VVSGILAKLNLANGSYFLRNTSFRDQSREVCTVAGSDRIPELKCGEWQLP
jgi:hypothetical protein